MKHRSSKTDAEFSKVQKLTQENKKLKQSIGSLRKQIDRLEAGWCLGCLQKHEEEHPDEMPPKIENQGKKKDWKCFQCNEGKLTIFKYNKASEIWYFRQCKACGYRTQGKKFEVGVEEG